RRAVRDHAERAPRRSDLLYLAVGLFVGHPLLLQRAAEPGEEPDALGDLRRLGGADRRSRLGRVLLAARERELEEGGDQERQGEPLHFLTGGFGVGFGLSGLS